MCVKRNVKHINYKDVLGRTYKDVLGRTSNFCAHLHTSHAAEYGEFQQRAKPSKGKPLPKDQPTVTLLFAKGFMNVTIHWMDKHTFDMHMCCLATHGSECLGAF